jgi:prophage regulatory protein
MENKQLGLSLHRLPAVCALTGLRKSSIYAMVREGSFPAPVRISRRAVAWRHDELMHWVDSRRATNLSPVRDAANHKTLLG